MKKEDIPQKGDVYFDDISDVKVMGFIDGYVMARRKGAMPFVLTLKQFQKNFIFRCDKDGKSV